jgi:spermidine synthase
VKSFDKVLLGACFFLSGATSLVLEVAWSKELSYTLGNTLYAVATVVAAFMAGLALGSAVASLLGHRIQAPLRAYAILQFAVASFAAISIPLFRAAHPLFRLVYEATDPSTAFLIRFAVVMVFLILPTTLMGMTVPIVVGAFGRRHREYAFDGGVLYGVNTLGAVVGTFAAGFVLIPALGLWGSCVAAATVDAFIGLLAWSRHARIGRIVDLESEALSSAAPTARPDIASPATPWTKRQLLVGLLFGVSGATALACEVAWFRLLGLTLGPSVFAFAAMLGCFLLGVGAGSGAAARWAQNTRLPGIEALALLQAVMGMAVVGGLYYLNFLPGWNFQLYGIANNWSANWGFAVAHLAVAASVVGAPCLVMGAMFPVAIRAVSEIGSRRTQPEIVVGKLYTMNTVGGIIGSLVAGMWLLPSFGAWRLLAGAGLVSAAIAAILWAVSPRLSHRRRAAHAVAVMMIAVTAATFAPAWNRALFNQGYYREIYTTGRMDLARRTHQKLIFYREGVNSPVAVFNDSGEVSLRVMGKADASTNAGDLTTQLLAGHLPVLFAREPGRVAVIGYGSGISAMAALAHPPVRTLDVIEIERAVIDASSYFEHISGAPLDDPRAHLVLEDGRTHLTYTDRVYDVITSEPSNPWMAGVSNLFTVDFYRTAKDRLSTNGIFGQWIQTYEISLESFRVILASLREVFPHVVLFQSGPTDVIVLASSQQIRMDWSDLQARFETPAVHKSLERVGITSPFDLTSFVRGGDDVLDEFLNGLTPRNTDDNAWLEYRMPRDLANAMSPVPQTVADTITSLGADRHLRSLQAMIPGISVEQSAKRTLENAFGKEPVLLPSGVVVDASKETRAALLVAISGEISQAGARDLLNNFALWQQEQQSLLDNRSSAQKLLAASLARGRIPDIATAEQALALAPNLPPAVLVLANGLYSQGRLAEAEHHYLRLTTTPTIATYDSLVGLGNIAARRGQFDQATALLQRAIAWNPYLPNAYASLTVVYLNRKDVASAQDTLSRALQLIPGEPQLESGLKSLSAAQLP